MDERLEELYTTLNDYLDQKQYVKLREWLRDLNVADIAAMMEELDEELQLKTFRILPKDMAADIFSYLPIEVEQ